MTTVYTSIQQRWLKFHFTEWQTRYGWDPQTFAQKTKQPAAALAEVLDIPLEEFMPPPAPAAPAPPPAAPAALPTPATVTLVIDGVEVMPREAPKTPPPRPAPSRAPGISLRPGRHVIDGVVVEVPPDGDRDLVDYQLAPGQHIVDQVMVRIDRRGEGIPIDLSSIGDDS